jgi:predicted AlkP superfamily phosphohydrolase/phosphomutase
MEQPRVPTSLDDVEVDWSRTRAWGWGGYYARIFLNVEGRETNGTIPSGLYDEARDELARELETITDHRGRSIPVAVHRPENLYPVSVGDRPDLMVYIDDLNWRSAGTVGHPSMHLTENDTGPDDSVHAMDGVFLLYDPLHSYGQTIRDIGLTDIAPTVLRLLGVPVPGEMEGRCIDAVLPSAPR